MRRTKFFALAGAIGVAGTLFLASPAWASGHPDFDFDFDDFSPSKYQHGFDKAVACEDGYYSIKGDKSDDDHGDFKVRQKDEHKGHDDCVIVEN